MVWLFGLVVGVVFVGVGGFLLWYGLGSVDLGVGAFRTPEATIAEAIASGNQSLVGGTATGARESGDTATVVGPFSGHEALLVEYEVRELRYQDDTRVRIGGKSNFQKSWQTIEERRTAIPFEIEDGTASAVVDADEADVTLSVDQRTRVKGGRKPPEEIRKFIEGSETIRSEERQVSFGPIKVRTGNDRRYVERRIEPGDGVNVFGVAEHSAGSTDGRIDRGDPYVVSDTSKLGTVRRYLVGGAGWLAFGGVFALVGLGIVVFAL